MIPAPRTGQHDAAPYPAATLTAAIAGDRAAFAELWRAHHGEVLRFARSRVLDPATAEDIASETFVHALRRIGAFVEMRGTAGMAGWLITIARNLIADLHKSNRHRREYATAEFYDADLLAEDPAAIVVDAIIADMVRSAVAGLTPQQRDGIRARYLEQLSVAEAAEQLGCSDGAVKALTFRAIRTLARESQLTEDLITQ